MSPSVGAIPERSGNPAKKYLVIKPQPSKMIIVQSVSLELDPSWRLMFVELVSAQAPTGLVHEITIGHGYAYVTYHGSGEQAEDNRQTISSLVDSVVASINPDGLTLWTEQREAEAMSA